HDQAVVCPSVTDFGFTFRAPCQKRTRNVNQQRPSDHPWDATIMDFRPLGRTGLKLSTLSFGASSLGQEFRPVDLNEAIRSVRVALDLGMNFTAPSPYSGRGLSECLLGIALREVPRDRYFLGTKLGRYDPVHFDFSARRVVESVDVSLQRLG